MSRLPSSTRRVMLKSLSATAAIGGLTTIGTADRSLNETDQFNQSLRSYLGSDVDRSTITTGGYDNAEVTMWAEKYDGHCHPSVPNTYIHTIQVGAHLSTYNDASSDIAPIPRLVSADFSVTASGDATAIVSPNHKEWNGGWENVESEPASADLPSWANAAVHGSWALATSKLKAWQAIISAMSLGYIEGNNSDMRVYKEFIFDIDNTDKAAGCAWMKIDVYSKMYDVSEINVSVGGHARDTWGSVWVPAIASDNFSLQAPGSCPDMSSKTVKTSIGECFITVHKNEADMEGMAHVLPEYRKEEIRKKGYINVERGTSLGNQLEKILNI